MNNGDNNNNNNNGAQLPPPPPPPQQQQPPQLSIEDELDRINASINDFTEILYYGRILTEEMIEVLEEMHPTFIQSQVNRIQQLIEANIDNPPVLKRLFDMFERANRATDNFEKKKAEARDPFKVLEAENVAQKSTALDMVRLPDPPEEEEVLEDITCPICFDDVEGDKCIKLKSCGHQYCLDCLDEYISVLVKDGRVAEVKCPNPECKGNIEYFEILKILKSDEVLAKYEEFLFQSALKAEPNLRWCPAPNCGNAMIGDPSYPKMVCDKCKKEFCFKCGEDWHSGTCEEYQEWKKENNEEDKRYAEWVKSHTKACPQCKAVIEKNSGCNHMTCTNCGYQFCWLCGGKYTENHFSPLNVFGCPGQQFTEGDDLPKGSKFSSLKRIGRKVLIGAGIVVGAPIAVALAVPAAVVGAPIAGGVYAYYRRRR